MVMREGIEEENLPRDVTEKQRRNPEKRETSRGRVPGRKGKMSDMQKEEKRGHRTGEVTRRGEKRRIKENRADLMAQTGTVVILGKEEKEEMIERKERRGTEESETGS